MHAQGDSENWPMIQKVRDTYYKTRFLHKRGRKEPKAPSTPPPAAPFLARFLPSPLTLFPHRCFCCLASPAGVHQGQKRARCMLPFDICSWPMSGQGAPLRQYLSGCITRSAVRAGPFHCERSSEAACVPAAHRAAQCLWPSSPPRGSPSIHSSPAGAPDLAARHLTSPGAPTAAACTAAAAAAQLPFSEPPAGHDHTITVITQFTHAFAPHGGRSLQQARETQLARLDKVYSLHGPQ